MYFGSLYGDALDGPGRLPLVGIVRITLTGSPREDSPSSSVKRKPSRSGRVIFTEGVAPAYVCEAVAVGRVHLGCPASDLAEAPVQPVRLQVLTWIHLRCCQVRLRSASPLC